MSVMGDDDGASSGSPVRCRGRFRSARRRCNRMARRRRESLWGRGSAVDIAAADAASRRAAARDDSWAKQNKARSVQTWSTSSASGTHGHPSK